MKALVVYDSVFGNTEQIAQAIGSGLGNQAQVEILRVSQVQPDELTGTALLIVGSPTQKFRPLPGVAKLLKGIPQNGLTGVKVAAFDTRFPESEIKKNRVLALFVRLFGYAAEPIADRLEKKGGELIAPPEGFYVGGVEGPLLEDELARAADWARQISK
jgi:flavodoxin